MNLTKHIESYIAQALTELYEVPTEAADISLTPTRKEFDGHYTFVVFPYTRAAKKKPEAIAEELGQWLVEKVAEIETFNVIKGFLNLSIHTTFWKDFVLSMYNQSDFGRHPRQDSTVLVEFSSPNTNKPLHLGHVRNILLGWSASQILDAAGYDVKKIQIINDRGIAICKSMLAWQRFGEGQTPESVGIKGDHFVGKYYVLFEQKFSAEYDDWQHTEEAQSVLAQQAKEDEAPAAFFKRYKTTYFNEYSSLGQAAKQMLLAWEAGDPDIIALWKQMNEWVYRGYNQTYDRLGVQFDKLYYESQTYVLGKDIIEKGLEKGVFYKKEDGSVWADLSDAKLDQKAVLRSDGTSLYITQDLGTARLRYEDFKAEKMVYTVADEQNYHFQVLFALLERLEEPYAPGLHHLSYGMVDLPSGRMKSREGTIVDADDLMAEVIHEARANSLERDTTANLSEAERNDIIEKIGLAALKYHIIRVNPQKRMTFDPKESVDLQGQTGPYIQNAYVRIQSVLRRHEHSLPGQAKQYTAPLSDETNIASQLYAFPELVQQAAGDLDPSLIANYAYELAKTYHKFYHDHSILNAETEAMRDFRLVLSQAVALVLKQALHLLGIEMPERM